jgi:subtilase family serine protease
VRDLGTAGNQFFNSLWQQAAAQGITVLVPAGDSGSAGCDDFTRLSPAPALSGLSVNGVASTPWNVAVGGTDFDDLNNGSAYWKFANEPGTQASAKGYIPETTWNTSCTNPLLSQLGYSTDAETNCNNSQLLSFLRTLGGSGGRSAVYPKPSWQSGPGVPNDGRRDIPDVSLFAATGRIAGSFYVVCQQDANRGHAPCDLDSPYLNIQSTGGTSLTAPAFAGIMALVTQITNSRQGNANSVFYKLAAQQPAADCNSSQPVSTACIFNDIASGTIAMPCTRGTTNCNTSNSSRKYAYSPAMRPRRAMIWRPA